MNEICLRKIADRAPLGDEVQVLDQIKQLALDSDGQVTRPDHSGMLDRMLQLDEQIGEVVIGCRHVQCQVDCALSVSPRHLPR